MEREISLEGGKYKVQHGSQGLEFKRHGELWPAVEDLRYVNVVAAMYYRVLELEDQVRAKDERLALADQQYAGVVLALGEAAATIEALQKRGPVHDHAKALEDALWVYKKETGALAGGPEMKAVESAIAAYLQHGVKK